MAMGRCILLFEEKGGSMNKKKSVVEGSVEEFMSLLVKDNYRGNVGELYAAFSEQVYCHNRKHLVPLDMASVLTPFNGMHLTLDQHVVCEMDCGRACQQNNQRLDVFPPAQTFVIGSPEKGQTIKEQLKAGKFVSSSSPLAL